MEILEVPLCLAEGLDTAGEHSSSSSTPSVDVVTCDLSVEDPQSGPDESSHYKHL